MRRLIVILVPLLAILMVVIWRTNGPAPLPLDAPEKEFSSARAMRTLEWLLDQQLPHPMGTKANALMRSGIVSQFRAHGYETSIQRRFACNVSGNCGSVENIIARLPKQGRGEAVVMMAHYDSVGAGPGASDDAMGVAALLEIARTVRNERFTNRVLFLITDGEEAGLLGAEAFLADPALSRDVAVAVNVENRGTYGASNMFETSRGNRWLVRHLASALPRPQASSLFSTIYDLLPNDTDVSVFKREGKAAINFAAIRGVHWYHTPLDDLAHASPRTLQHHGENLLATLRALGSADLAARSRSDAVFFDLLGFTLIWWPAGWTPWIAGVSLALLVWAARREPPREMTFGVLATFAAILTSVAGGATLSWIGRLRSAEFNWVARPGSLVAAMWLAGIAAALFAAALFRKRAGERTMLYGVAIVWHVMALVLAITLPGPAYIFLVPALAVTLAALARLNETVTAAIASAAGGIVLFPVVVMLYEALGGRLIVVAAPVVALFVMLFAPLFAKYELAAAALVVALVSTVAAMVQPPFNEERPRQLSLSWVDDPAAGSPKWRATAMTPQLASAAPFKYLKTSTLLPWPGPSWEAPSTAGLAVPRVQLSGQRKGEKVTLRVRSSRQCDRTSILIHGAITGLRVNGLKLPPPTPRHRTRLPKGWSFASVAGRDGLDVEFSASGKIDVIASDTTFGLPGSEAGVAILKGRDASTAVPVHDGDVTITRARAAF